MDNPIRIKTNQSIRNHRPWSFSDVLAILNPTKSKNTQNINNDDLDILDDQIEDVYDRYDNDDVFLSSPSINSIYCNSTAMQKSKSGSTSSSSKGVRLNPRKIWARSRSKSQSRASGGSNGIWTSQGGGAWTCSSTGRQVYLNDGHLLGLTDVEIVALRHVAMAKLQAMDLGCSISMPKVTEDGAAEKPKRRALLLKRRAVTTGFLDGNKDNNGRVDSAGHVFGVPLVKCVRNDRAMRRSASAPLRDVANLLVAHLMTGSASAEDISNEKLLASRGYMTGSKSSCNIPLDVIKASTRKTSNVNEKNDESSIESLGLVCKSRSISRLSMLDEFQDWAVTELDPDPLVPEVVNTCFKHIESYGLHQLGIFRVSSSKKRVRQLREDFDTGKEVQLSEDHCPHDVATLLKEYFRDLPEPLLTRDLYMAFVATQKIRNRRQQMDALKHLVQLLPVANRDTLWALLRFLSKVANHADDQRIESGEWVTGNKMDANNLATLFGPNILHMAKPTSSSSGGCSTVEYQVESLKRADERIEVIKAVRTMIDNYKELYEVPTSLMDDVYRRLSKHNPEDLGRLLQARLLPLEIEMDPDTGSSACSETTSISHMPIDASMEVSPTIGPLVISLSTDQIANKTRTISQSGENNNYQEELYGTDMRRGSGTSSGSRTELATSLGRNKESVASRLFRRRDKSVVRASGEENEERRLSREDKSESESSSSRWFRRKDRDREARSSGSAIDSKKTTEEMKKKLKKDIKDTKSRTPVTRGSVSEGSIGGGSDSRSSSLKSASADSMKSLIRPLKFQETSNTDQQQRRQEEQQVSVVDIRKEHLQIQEPNSNERRLSTSDLEIISASLTLKVPLSRSQTGPALAFGQDTPITHDIPYIEDNQPEVAVEPAPRFHVRQRYLDRKHKSSPFFQQNDSVATATNREIRTRTRGSRQSNKTGTSPTSANPLTTSTSASAIVLQNDKAKRESTQPRSRGSSSSSSSSINPSSRRLSGTTAGTTTTNQWPQETWKRWEIISSEHTEQETVV